MPLAWLKPAPVRINIFPFRSYLASDIESYLAVIDSVFLALNPYYIFEKAVANFSPNAFMTSPNYYWKLSIFLVRLT